MDDGAHFRRQLLAVLLVVGAIAIVLFAGIAGPPRTAPIGTDRLGPEQGERVTDYLAHAQDSLTGSDEPRFALVSLDAELTPGRALDVAAGLRITDMVYRVPLPRVQTKLTVVGVGEGRESVLGSAEIATELLRTSAMRPGVNDRQLRADLVSAQRIAAGCACVAAMAVRGTPTDLTALAARDGVRAVEALPADAVAGRFALVPLLPEQVDVIEPLPDDGEVPAA